MEGATGSPTNAHNSVHQTLSFSTVRFKQIIAQVIVSIILKIIKVHHVRVDLDIVNGGM